MQPSMMYHGWQFSPHPSQHFAECYGTQYGYTTAMFRKLRIAWSVAWGIAAVLLIALWVRSYGHDDFLVKTASPGFPILESSEGRFTYFPSPSTTSSDVPYWLPVVTFTALATAPWLRRISWRFSLRTLLIATTLVGVGLGTIIVLSR